MQSHVGCTAVTARTVQSSCNAIHDNACKELRVCAAMVLHAVMTGSDTQKICTREAHVHANMCHHGNVPGKHTILDLLEFPSFDAVNAALTQPCADSYIL